MQFSSLLQQLGQCPNAQLHIDRLLDTCAATTVVKYFTALGLGAFLAGLDLRLNLDALNEVQLADVLLVGCPDHQPKG